MLAAWTPPPLEQQPQFERGATRPGTLTIKKAIEFTLSQPLSTVIVGCDNVAQLNARELDAAFESLTRADKAAPNQEHVRYALAAVCALQGNADAGLEHLAAAIELRSANRSMAAQDQDFHLLSSDSRFQRLIRWGVA